MATRNLTITKTPDRMVLYSWTNLLNTDDGAVFTPGKIDGLTFLVTGTFGAGGTVQIEGSNDGVNFAPLVAGVTAAGAVLVANRTLFIRPRVSAGDGTTNLAVTAAASF